MTTAELEQKYPFLMKYFKGGIERPDKNIAHCILFYGENLQAQYELALEIARLLNCTKDRMPDCDCLNCRWIRENKHPAVQTVSKYDYVEKSATDTEDVTNKKAIKIEQARAIKNSLLTTSDYHRVFIFCDKDKEGEDGKILGLNFNNFQEATANALLKTFEEPPEGTTFFFLTKNKTDMLATIVSRAQCFFVPSTESQNRDYSLVEDVMDGYLELPRNEVLDLCDNLTELTKEHELDEVLDGMQNYLCALLKTSLSNPMLRLKLIKDITAVEHAKQESKLKMDSASILETLCFALVLEK